VANWDCIADAEKHTCMSTGYPATNQVCCPIQFHRKEKQCETKEAMVRKLVIRTVMHDWVLIPVGKMRVMFHPGVSGIWKEVCVTTPAPPGDGTIYFCVTGFIAAKICTYRSFTVRLWIMRNKYNVCWTC